MPVDYEKISDENLERYGWDIERVAKMAFADSYADRTHFIFELLQNAEDALRRRGDSWDGDRTVSFLLSQDLLRVSHYGEPFNGHDVRGICGIGESTKPGDYTTIGHFGIGFKSVYKFTEMPQVHSGDEDFVIDSFVWPKASDLIKRDPNETVFLIPLDRESSVDDNDEIAEALAKLDVRTFLFLRQIEELKWEVEDCDSGHYLRETKVLDKIARRVNVIGHVKDLDGNESDFSEEWLIFSREVRHSGMKAGNVEIAFYIDSNTGNIRGLEESKLVVYFPTVVETSLGFLVQGPYRTTPNRDNVPKDDDWNRYLVEETGLLLQDTLRWLRDRDMLDVEVLRCMPLKSFPDNILNPLYDVTKKLFSKERLLPKFQGGYVNTEGALMAETGTIRDLLSEQQISDLYGRSKAWLSDEFTVDRNPELRQYIMSELGFSETSVEAVLGQIKPEFLKDQSDSWMIQLYEYLGTQRALWSRLRRLPLIRLSNGNHVPAEINGVPNVHLPTSYETGFRTVSENVCASDEAIYFLASIGIKQPDIVDDVIANVLTKYQSLSSVHGDEEYASDIDRICRAYESVDSDPQRRKRLLDALTENPWVMTIDSGHNRRQRSKPRNVYLSTDRMNILFSTLSGLRFVDQEYECLQNDVVESLLLECGASDNLRAIKLEASSRFSDSERKDMRIKSHDNSGFSTEEVPQDWQLEELEQVLQSMDKVDINEQKQISYFLWEALSELDRKYFEGEYSWFYYSSRSCKFDSSFIDLLNTSAWIATEEEGLKPPGDVDFDELGWTPNEFLQSKIKFKSSEIQNVAKKHGMDPGLLDQILKRFASGELTEDDFAFPANKDTEIENNNMTGLEADVSTNSSAEFYAQSLQDAMTMTPTDAADSPVMMPVGGPKTSESAQQDTLASLRQGRSGRRVTSQISRFEPSKTARSLDEKFKNMLLSDYNHRCQICGKTFLTRKGNMQVFADNVVSPREGAGTNHFGNLMSLCGWHYALINYGQWVLLDPITEEPVNETGQDRDVRGIIELLEKADIEWDDGNEFITLPIRFWNIYSDWKSDSEHVDTEIRFSLPHRTYLVELLNA